MQTLQRTFSTHLASFIGAVGIFVLSAILLHRLIASLAGAFDEAEQQRAELQIVNELAQSLAGKLDPNEIAFDVTEATQRALGADGENANVTLVLYDEEEHTLRVMAVAGSSGGGAIGRVLRMDQIPPLVRETVVEKCEPLTFEDTEADPERWQRAHLMSPEVIRSYAALPLVSRGRLLAVMFCTASQAGVWNAQNVRIAGILAQTAAGTLLATRDIASAEERAQREAVANSVATLTLSTLDADSVLEGAAAALGAALRASRAVVWMGASPTELTIRHEWLAPDVPSEGPGTRQAQFAGRAAAGGSTVAIRDARVDSQGEPGGDTGDTLSVLATPMMLAGQLVGALVVEQTNRTREWTSGDIRLIDAVARELRVAVETVRMYEARKHESERMVALSRVSAALAAQTDPSAVVAEILKNAVDLMSEKASGTLLVWVEEAKVLHAVRHHNMPESLAQPYAKSGQGVGGRAFAELAPVIINDYQDRKDSMPELQAMGQVAAIAVPLMRGGVPLGALSIRSFDPALRFTEEDARLLALFADQAVSALTAAEAFQKQAAAVEDLERLSKAKSDFISIVSHEFRTPLTGIQGFAEMMRDEDLAPDEMKEYAGDIYKDARRLNRMITEMLDLDRMESGRMKLNPESVDLNEIVRETTEHAMPTAPMHTITTDLSPLPMITGDRDKLVQVMTNLLSNAVKYSPDGGAIIVSSRLDGTDAHITVRDHGLGMPPEALEKIFERFSRIETETTRYIQGTGLGLPIVRQIAEMHGGRVWAESILGEGSTMHLTIPVGQAA